jgi:hypothetical protein
MSEQTEKAFKVRITIGGLCMFAPQASRKIMHVLMPKTGDRAARGDDASRDGAHTMHEQHYLAFVWDTASENPSGAGPSCFKYADLTGCLVRIGDPISGDPSMSLDAGNVLRLNRELCFGGVNPECVGDESYRHVGARVELLTGGNPHYHSDPGVDDRICLKDAHGTRKRCQRMVQNVDWIIDGFSGWLDPATLFRTSRLDPSIECGTHEFPARLYPRGTELNVQQLHVVAQALPRDCRIPEDKGSGPAHFSAYYRLATHTVCDPLEPELESKSFAQPSVKCMVVCSPVP